MTSILVVDVETTGLSPETHRVVEFASVRVVGPPWRLDPPYFTSLSHPGPGLSIPPELSAVHHITDEDVAGAVTLKTVMEYADQSGALNCDYVAAHNAPFDRSFIERIYPITVMGWICTCQAARHVWPDAPNYKNQTLRYYLKLKPNLPSSLAPHRALYDAIVTAEILLKLLEHHTPEELLELSSKRALLRTVGFGKHYGRPWSEMESGYLSWILTKDFDADIEHTARYWLNRKRGAA